MFEYKKTNHKDLLQSQGKIIQLRLEIVLLSTAEAINKFCIASVFIFSSTYYLLPYEFLFYSQMFLLSVLQQFSSIEEEKALHEAPILS